MTDQVGLVLVIGLGNRWKNVESLPGEIFSKENALLVERNPTKVEAHQQRGYTAFYSVEEAFAYAKQEGRKVDRCLVLTKPESHCEFIGEALEHGVPLIFSECPLASHGKLEKAQQVLAQGQEASLVSMGLIISQAECFQEFMGDYGAAARTMRSAKVTWVKNRMDPTKPANERGFHGVFYEALVHALALISDMLGEVPSLKSISLSLENEQLPNAYKQQQLKDLDPEVLLQPFTHAEGTVTLTLANEDEFFLELLLSMRAEAVQRRIQGSFTLEDSEVPVVMQFDSGPDTITVGTAEQLSFRSSRDKLQDQLTAWARRESGFGLVGLERAVELQILLHSLESAARDAAGL